MRPSPTRIFGALQAWLYDIEMRLAARDLNPRRRAIVGAAKGLVLELGIGTAQNAPFYNGDSEVIGIDPDTSMLARARTRVSKGAAHITLIAASGEALPFAQASFDSVVVTLALCSVESQARTLQELHRVLKPGGRLHFMEHVRSDNTRWAAFQDFVTPFWKTVASG